MGKIRFRLLDKMGKDKIFKFITLKDLKTTFKSSKVGSNSS
jgi:hypothetical protein